MSSLIGHNSHRGPDITSHLPGLVQSIINNTNVVGEEGEMGDRIEERKDKGTNGKKLKKSSFSYISISGCRLLVGQCSVITQIKHRSTLERD